MYHNMIGNSEDYYNNDYISYHILPFYCLSYCYMSSLG